MSNSRTVKAGILSFGRLLTNMVSLVSAMVLARIFTKEDYGTYRQTMMVYRLAAPFMTLGLPQAIYYFMPNQPERKRNILANNMGTLALMGSLFTAFLLFGGSDFLATQLNNPELANTLRVIAWYPLFLLPVLGLSPCLMVNNRVKQLATFDVISRVVMLVAVLVPVFIWRSAFAGILGVVLAAAIVMGPAVWLMLRAADTGAFRLKWSGIKTQLKFAVPLGVAGMLGSLSINLDKILVSKFFEPETFAVYVNGAMEIPLIGMITGSATAVLLPDITRMIGLGNRAEALELWKRAAVKCGLIIFPVMGFLMAMAPEVMTLLYGGKYVGSAVPFRIYLLLLPIRIAFFGTLFIGAGKSNLILVRSAVGLLLNLILSVFLIGIIGYLGAVIATVLVTYFWAVGFNLEWMKRYFSCGFRDLYSAWPLGRLLLGAVCAGTVSYVVALYLNAYNPIIRVGVGGTVYVAVLAGIYQWLRAISIDSIIQWAHQKVRR